MINARSLLMLSTLLSTAAIADITPVFDVPTLPQTCPASPFGAVCSHIIGGRSTRIALPVIPDEPCEETKLQLYQLSERLEAPVAKPVLAACRDAIIEVPEVKALTYFRLTRQGVRAHGQTQMQQDSDPTHVTLLAVYPADQLAELKEWSASNRLIVNDQKQKLIPFLEARGIRFARMTDPLPPEEKAQSLCLWISDEPAQNAPERCKAVITFRTPLNSISPIRESLPGSRHIIEADEAMLQSLDTHPLVQRTFAQIIQSALQGEYL